jgi:hypothetical protein
MFLPSMWKKAKPWRFAADCTAFSVAWLGRNHTPPRFVLEQVLERVERHRRSYSRMRRKWL